MASTALHCTAPHLGMHWVFHPYSIYTYNLYSLGARPYITSTHCLFVIVLGTSPSDLGTSEFRDLNIDLALHADVAIWSMHRESAEVGVNVPKVTRGAQVMDLTLISQAITAWYSGTAHSLPTGSPDLKKKMDAEWLWRDRILLLRMLRLLNCFCNFFVWVVPT